MVSKNKQLKLIILTLTYIGLAAAIVYTDEDILDDAILSTVKHLSIKE